MVVLLIPVSTSHTFRQLSHPAVMMSSPGPASSSPPGPDPAHTTAVTASPCPWNVASGVRVVDFKVVDGESVLGLLADGKSDSCSVSSNSGTTRIEEARIFLSINYIHSRNLCLLETMCLMCMGLIILKPALHTHSPDDQTLTKLSHDTLQNWKKKEWRQFHYHKTIVHSELVYSPLVHRPSILHQTN